MTLPAYKFRDPQIVVEIEQDKSCAGCRHKFRWVGMGVDMCALKNCLAKKRCGKYQLPEKT